MLNKGPQRNSNMPPNSGLRIESDLLADSRLSNIEPVLVAPPVIEESLTLPISGAKVLKYYLKRSGLTEFEKTEVLDFKQVYFLGLGSNKI